MSMAIGLIVSDYDDSTCMGCYITRLDLKEVQEVEKVSIDWGESEPVALPAIQPSTACCCSCSRAYPRSLVTPIPVRNS